MCECRARRESSGVAAGVASSAPSCSCNQVQLTMMMESSQDGVVNLAGASPAEVPNDPGWVCTVHGVSRSVTQCHVCGVAGRSCVVCGAVSVQCKVQCAVRACV